MTARAKEIYRQRKTIDIAGIEDTLKFLALSALDRVLFSRAASPDRDPAPDWNHMRILAELLPDSTNSDPLTKGACTRLESVYQMNEPENWSTSQRSIVAMAVKPGWRNNLRYVQQRGFRKRLAPPPPESGFLAEIIARAAWSEPVFRVAVIRSIRASLRREVIMTSGRGALPVLSNQFWWILIAMALDKILPENRVFDSGRLQRGIVSHAQISSKTAGWAGFWEQYLLLRAQRAHLPNRLVPVNLPLFASGPEALLGDTVDDPDSQSAIRPGWQSEAPEYAIYLLKGRY